MTSLGIKNFKGCSCYIFIFLSLDLSLDYVTNETGVKKEIFLVKVKNSRDVRATVGFIKIATILEGEGDFVAIFGVNNTRIYMS